MEEFRRRKNLKEYWGQMTDMQRKTATALKNPRLIPITNQPEFLAAHEKYAGSGAERFFEPGNDDIFNPNDFQLLFLDSDSVTNVTSLNRTN